MLVKFEHNPMVQDSKLHEILSFLTKNKQTNKHPNKHPNKQTNKQRNKQKPKENKQNKTKANKKRVFVTPFLTKHIRHFGRFCT